MTSFTEVIERQFKTCRLKTITFRFLFILFLVLLTLIIFLYTSKNQNVKKQVQSSNWYHMQKMRINITKGKYLVTDNRIGFMNMYMWYAQDFCLSSSQGVYWNPLFPNYPSEAKLVESINDIDGNSRYAIRRFNFYLLLSNSGEYIVGISVGCGCDVFIYEIPDENAINFKYSFKFENQVGLQNSSNFHLDGSRLYLIDIIHWMNKKDKMTLMWKRPDSKEFEVLRGSWISALTLNNSINDKMLRSPVNLESNFMVQMDPRRNFYNLKQVKLVDLVPDIETCDYEPSYLFTKPLKLYTGVYNVNEGRSFPNFYIFMDEVQDRILKKDTAVAIAEEALQTIERNEYSKQRGYKFKNVIFIGENQEEKHGKRYFVQLDLLDQRDNSVVRLSDYFYKPNEASSFCFPRHLHWRKNAFINIIFTTSANQHKWALLLLDAIANIVHTTNDHNINVIVVDFSTQNVNFDVELNKRRLNYTLVPMVGRFNKVKGINRGASVIRDPDSIVFTIDLHLQLPLFLFDEVRKNTIYGKAVYAPVLIRLSCGKHVEYTDAFESLWVSNGFGMISMFKRDWELIGGMNERLFGEKWGGEDWELIDRVLSKHYEVIQRKLPGFYHIYHNRGETWS